jgi:formylglycine-generating enzyme required for sulfatase activity
MKLRRVYRKRVPEWHRAVRGGDWYDNASYLRAAYRSNGSPSYQHYSIGPRLSKLKGGKNEA